MACTKKQFLTVAASQIGYKESPAGSNKTKYGQWYPMNGAAWCDMFISWCAWKVQARDIIGKFAYTPNHMAWFDKRGQWHKGTKGIQAGDIAFFRFYGKRIHHIGVVEGVRSNGSIVTIEGNTSTGDNRNGGMVMRRVRNSKYIVGYGRPAYKPEPTAAPKPVTVPKPIPTTIPKPKPVVKQYVLKRALKRGMVGADVKKLQQVLNAKKFAVGKTDGEFGSSTEAALKRFQKSKNLTADGVAGKSTARALGWNWKDK